MGKIIIYSQQIYTATLIAEVIADTADVEYCDTPEELIRHCIEHKPDLVIIIAIAPFLNGSHIIRRIRFRGGRRPAIYVIAWHQSEHIVLSLLECGVDQYMTFPICMGRLQSKINQFLQSNDTR